MWEILANTMRNSAEWRKSVAERHPEDAGRNEQASALLDRLADEVASIADPLLAERYAAACEGDQAVHLSEAEQEEIRSIGFHSEPESGEAFVNSILDRLH